MEREATREELEAIRDKMLQCLDGLLVEEAIEVALNVYGFVATTEKVNVEDAVAAVIEYYDINSDEEGTRADH